MKLPLRVGACVPHALYVRGSRLISSYLAFRLTFHYLAVFTDLVHQTFGEITRSGVHYQVVK
jgi:hypothetical protein